MVIIWLIMGNNNLVGGFSLPLWKMMEWKSVGMMKSPIWWEKMFQMFQTTNQPKKVWHSTNSAQKLYLSLS